MYAAICARHAVDGAKHLTTHLHDNYKAIRIEEQSILNLVSNFLYPDLLINKMLLIGGLQELRFIIKFAQTKTYHKACKT